GAATPVRVGAQVGAQVSCEEAPPVADGESEGEPDGDPGEEENGASGDAMSAKMIEDAVAYIRGLANLHGRNAEWAEKAVREAASLSASEAEQQKVVDLVAGNLEGLLAGIDGRSVVMEHGASLSLSTGNMAVVERDPDWRARFLAISLLLALFSLSILPLDYAGLALLLLGVALMTAEAFAPSFGVLGVGGAVAFALGAAMLFDDLDAPGFELSWWTIGSMTVLSLL